MANKKIAIIEGLDFLGCYITLKFLAEDYMVKAISTITTTDPCRLIRMDSLSAVENLEICYANTGNGLHLKQLLNDCQIVVHSGVPYKIEIQGVPCDLYIPVIKQSAIFLDAISHCPLIEKVFIILSPTILFPKPAPDAKSKSANKVKSSFVKEDRESTYASSLYHADKIITSRITQLRHKLFEVILVPPVEVIDNKLSNSRESTSLGLQYLFKNRIPHDPALEKLISQNVLETMIDVNQLPDVVFDRSTEISVPQL